MNFKRKYTVIYRACDVVTAVNKVPRPFGLGKKELIKICFLSLLDALRGVDYKIIVVGDKLSQEMIDFFNRFEVDLHLGTFGNDASIREALKIAQTIPDNEWVYFCEDDYLHVADSFLKIDHFLDERKDLFVQKIKPYNLSTLMNLSKKDLFIHPPDYPDRYLPKYRKHSLIFVSRDCHWRQINSMTFTFLTKASTVKKHLSLFIRTSEKAKDVRLSRKLFGRIGFGFMSKAICFSPLPGFSTHMHQTTMTPLVNWEKLKSYYSEKLLALK